MLFDFAAGKVGLFEFVIFIVAIVAAITIHEFAHAYRAHQAGDPTPGRQNRLTLNPLAHFDPIGTTAILLVGFGWGRAVMTQPSYYRHPRRDSMMIALWGPLSNVLLAIGLLLIIRFVPVFDPQGPWPLLLGAMVRMNLMLAFFNLIPLPPLDGSKVLSSLLPLHQAVKYDRFVQQFGMMVLLLLMVGGQRFISLWVGIPSQLIVNLFGFMG